MEILNQHSSSPPFIRNFAILSKTDRAIKNTQFATNIPSVTEVNTNTGSNGDITLISINFQKKSR